MRLLKYLKYLILLPIILLLFFNTWVCGSLLVYRVSFPSETMFMSLRMWSLKDKHPDLALDYRPVPYNEISRHLKRAIIASEDAKFTEHDGFDWQGIQHALKKNKKGIKAGGSTISQQLAKNLFLWHTKSYLRKAEEAFITALMESLMDKERIFTLYLNVIEWGEGIFGVEAAAQYYFKKSASQLNKQEAAVLAAMVTQPLYYQHHMNDRKLRKKTNIILKRMGASRVPDSPKE